jgi:hypothetical protein
MPEYRITKEHVWGGPIADHKGALAEKLRALSAGGLNLELIIAHRETTGLAMFFVSPLRTLAELDYAAKAGLARAGNVRAIRVASPNEAGLCARIASALADAGLNLAGFSALALGDRAVTSIAFDSDADADRAKAVLEKLLAS